MEKLLRLRTDPPIILSDQIKEKIKAEKRNSEKNLKIDKSQIQNIQDQANSEQNMFDKSDLSQDKLVKYAITKSLHDTDSSDFKIVVDENGQTKILRNTDTSKNSLARSQNLIQQAVNNHLNDKINKFRDQIGPDNKFMSDLEVLNTHIRENGMNPYDDHLVKMRTELIVKQNIEIKQHNEKMKKITSILQQQNIPINEINKMDDQTKIDTLKNNIDSGDIDLKVLKDKFNIDPGQKNTFIDQLTDNSKKLGNNPKQYALSINKNDIRETKERTNAIWFKKFLPTYKKPLNEQKKQMLDLTINNLQIILDERQIAYDTAKKKQMILEKASKELQTADRTKIVETEQTVREQTMNERMDQAQKKAVQNEIDNKPLSNLIAVNELARDRAELDLLNQQEQQEKDKLVEEAKKKARESSLQNDQEPSKYLKKAIEHYKTKRDYYKENKANYQEKFNQRSNEKKDLQNIENQIKELEEQKKVVADANTEKNRLEQEIQDRIQKIEEANSRLKQKDYDIIVENSQQVIQDIEDKVNKANTVEDKKKIIKDRLSKLKQRNEVKLQKLQKKKERLQKNLDRKMVKGKNVTGQQKEVKNL